MKKFTRFLALALVLVMALAVLCGCDDNESIYGTWTATTTDDEKDTRAFLESLEFWEEEIALMDLSSMKSVRKLQFNEDRTYELGFEAEGSKKAMAEFFDGMMEDLYNGRASLAEVYGEEIASLTRDEFNQAYADMFGCADYAEFRTWFVEEIVDFDSLEEENEVGTYNAALGNIYFTMEGESEAQPAEYEVKSGKLIVTFADMVIEYTKK